MRYLVKNDDSFFTGFVGVTPVWSTKCIHAARLDLHSAEMVIRQLRNDGWDGRIYTIQEETKELKDPFCISIGPFELKRHSQWRQVENHHFNQIGWLFTWGRRSVWAEHLRQIPAMIRREKHVSDIPTEG